MYDIIEFLLPVIDKFNLICYNQHIVTNIKERNDFIMSEQVQKVIEKGREYADIAGQKGYEMVEKARLYLKINEAKAELRKDYIKLGKQAYKAIKSGDRELSDEMRRAADCISIDMERVEFLTEELSEIRGVKLCAQCGSKNTESAKYCNNCGSEI